MPNANLRTRGVKAEERRRTFVLDTAQKSWKYFASQLMFISATSPGVAAN